ncbi:MAG: hypothetical protein GX601_17670 [Anaerolineales bacterium]|nr:hypothetical protein [Anaerolineales bacterium]
MRLANPFPELALGELLDTLLPDFVLAFAFFTALAYAVSGKRFDRQRPAIVMSAVIGLSLTVRLVWWERQNDLSIRDLGPLAVGFAIIILASVMYQAIRQTGGSWAGVGTLWGQACWYPACSAWTGRPPPDHPDCNHRRRSSVSFRPSHQPPKTPMNPPKTNHPAVSPLAPPENSSPQNHH